MSASRLVVVTGSARRIGAAVVRHLHGAGMDAVVHYRRSAADAHALVAELDAKRPGSAIAVQADLASAGGCARLIEQAAGWQQRIDYLVNNASSFYRTPIGSVSEAQWNELVDGNAKAAFFATQAALPWLRRSGRGAVVNVCDTRTERPLPQFGVYAAAKAGLVALTRALALELAPEVRVNAVAPGSLDWPEHAGVFSPPERDAIERAIPLRRLGSGADLAGAIEFLLTAGTYVTGHVLAVDGGSSLASC